ncbi:amino acid ABC transporter substrate-binding protein, partial [bacterium]|nr:amino acid ABC transporter substrate-binding protein [bacterium]
WCPYNGEPNSQKPGYLIELMEVVFHPLGYSIDYQLVPWQRALDLTAEGKTDAAVGAVQGNHGNTIIGNESLGSDETVFVVKEEKSFTYEGINSLSPLRLGFISNYTYDNNGPIDQYLHDRLATGDNIITVHNSKPLKSLFLMLNADRIDAFPENKYVAEFMAMNTSQAEEYQFISSNSGDDVFVAFSPTTRGKQLCKMLDQAVARMKRDGSLAALQARYGISSE